MAEGDGDWFKLMEGKRETPGQRLTWTVAEGMSIDTTAGMEFTEYIELETFPGDVAPFAGDKEEGAMTAKGHTEAPGEKSFWTNGSRLDSEWTWASIA